MSKKIFAFLLGVAALMTAGCTDLSEINGDLDNIKSELDALEARIKANQEAAAALDKAAKAGYVITGCQKFEGNPGGYTITFSQGDPITIYHGGNGSDGSNGEDGTSLFKSIEATDDAMIFTLSDGTEITIPLEEAFELVLGEPELIVDEEFVAIIYNYTIKAATEKTTVGGFAGGSYTVEVWPENEASGAINIICPNDAENNTVVVFADNGAGKTSVKNIAVPGEILEITAADFVLGAAGEEADILVTSNIRYSIEIEAEGDWLTLKPETKAIETHKHTIVAAPNSSPLTRTASVSIVDLGGTAVQTYSVTQIGMNIDDLSLEELEAFAKPIFGSGDGVEGIWDILYNEDYCILQDKPTFSMSCEAENLIDGDLSSKDGIWFSKFDSTNDDPIVFIYDMKASIIPTAFYVQQFTDANFYKVFKFYVASEYKGDETAWIELAHTDGTQDYMAEAEYDFQNEDVCNANGPTGKIAYTLTYKATSSFKAEGRYLKFEIYPVFDAAIDNAVGKGKLNEVYLTGIYTNPSEDPANYPHSLVPIYGGDAGTMEWEVLAGEDYVLGKGPDWDNATVGGGNYSVYSVDNLFNGLIGTPAWSTLLDWRGWYSTPLETPFEIIVDMKHVYTPKVFHVADEDDGTGGNWTDFGFYLADSYDPENPEATNWKLSVSKKLPAPGYGANNIYDYVSKEPVSGRYLKVKFNSSNGYSTYGIRNYCSLAEIWFDSYDNVLPSDKSFKVYGNGQWTILEGQDYSMATGGDRANAEAAFNKDNKYGEDGTQEYNGQTLAQAVDAESAFYSTAHLFDGDLETVWNTWAYTLNEYPIVFVVDLGSTHTPVAYHKVETPWCSGSNVDWTISLSDTYNGDATEWKVSFDGNFGPNNWTGGEDERVAATNVVSGRYMKISMNSWGGAIYNGGDGPYKPYRLAEIYFEECK